MAHQFFDLTGRVALVTGGGGVIGGASARTLAALGADVVVMDRREEPANATASDIASSGRRTMVLVGDAADYAVVERLARQAESEFDHVDILVNVAGGGDPRRMLEMERKDFDGVVANNLTSAWNWCRALAPGMLQRSRQRIVNIASISAKHGGGPPATISKSAYSAAKGGVLGLTKGLAKELAPHVTVNAVCPGLIETSRTERMTKGPERDQILATIPMGRFGEGRDIAGAVAFFASSAADWITGESMDVNGGQYID
jgi:3-oxoacyl-[acyl-carrier protein] reductase